MPNFTADQQAQAAALAGAGMPSIEADSVVTAIKTIAVSTGSSGLIAGNLTLGTSPTITSLSGGITFGRQITVSNAAQTLNITGAVDGSPTGPGFVFNVSASGTSTAVNGGLNMLGVGTLAVYGQLGVTTYAQFAGVSNCDRWPIIYPAASGGNAQYTVSTGNIALGGTTALSTSATDGMVMIPAGAGTPVGVPNGNGGGSVAMRFDTTSKRLFIYSGTSWLASGTMT